MSRARLLACLILALSGLFLAFSGGPARAEEPSIAQLKQRYKRPAAIPFPANNAYSDAKADLGQKLFFDPRLSVSGTMSCATCHNPAFAWQDGLRVGRGHNEQPLPRATPSVLDLAWADLLMWDGRKNGLEDQASGPVSTPAEMGGTLDMATGRVASVPEYRRAFRAAFGSPDVSFPRIAQAIATFERTLVSNKAPFDRWIDGDEGAISDSAKRGFVLFNGKAGCAVCHQGWRFTDDGFHDIGLTDADMGRAGQVPGVPILEHAFKTPTRRNVDQRAPYMHNGSIATLREVVLHYDSGFVERASLSPEMHRLGLSPTEVDDLVAFMHTLTSRDDPTNVPVLPSKEMN
jgi:cytochrome c peroxidase